MLQAKAVDNLFAGMTQQYRPEIDGLRAVSVTAVVLYHAMPSLAPGGFFGVDIFFVISGFLITRIIHDEIRAGTFSVFEFWKRRVRRIIPAFAVVCVASTILAAIVLFPPDFVDHSIDLMSAAGFVANITFYFNTHYFSAPAVLKPLLHLWSLSVEEQFYLLFPLIALVAARLRCLASALVILGIFSLISSLYFVRVDPSAVFYLLPFRAWELMLGAGLVVCGFRWSPAPMTAAIVSALGVLAILYSILVFDPAIESAASASVLPCLGAAAILRMNVRHSLSVVLSNAPIVFLGAISYSLYLWHWPLLAFSRYYLMGPLSLWQSIAVIFVSVVLAALSWKFVEQPFRQLKKTSAPKIVSAGGAAVLILFCAGLVVYQADGIPQRISAEAQAMSSYESKSYRSFMTAIRSGVCFMAPDQGPESFNVDVCLGRRENSRSVVLWGDSYAAHFYPGLHEVLEDERIQILQATASSCPPIMGLPVAQPNCSKLNEFFLANFKQAKPDIVILSSTWAAFQPEQFDKLDETLKSLANLGIDIVLLGPSPTYKAHVPRILARHIQLRRMDALDLNRFLVDGVFEVDRKMRRRYESGTLAKFVSVTDVLCEHGSCPPLKNGEPIVRDIGHLTPSGSELVVARLKPQLMQIIDGGRR